MGLSDRPGWLSTCDLRSEVWWGIWRASKWQVGGGGGSLRWELAVEGGGDMVTVEARL